MLKRWEWKREEKNPRGKKTKEREKTEKKKSKKEGLIYWV